MDNQIWNAEKGEGNAHLNPLRDKGHGRIYIIRHEDGDDSDITEIDSNDNNALIEGLKSNNLFWRITAQRLIVEENKTDLIPALIKLAGSDINEFSAVHALWSLKGLGVLDGSNTVASTAAIKALTAKSNAVKRAALSLLPDSELGSDELAKSSLMLDVDLHIRLAAMLRAGELPETDQLSKAIDNASKDPTNTSDKWLKAAIKIYYRELNYETVDAASVDMVIPSAEEKGVKWQYSEDKPADDWFSADFDDSSWQNGRSPFGDLKMFGIRTTWSKSGIWLRREVTLDEVIVDPVLKVMHDDNYEVYVNGQLLISEAGVSKPYKFVKLDAELGALFKAGKNIIAVNDILMLGLEKSEN
jgi:uncharacterized protein